jgi:hypothetical protein
VLRVPEVDGFEPDIIECAQERVEVLEEEVEQQRELWNRQWRLAYTRAAIQTVVRLLSP